MRSLLPGRTSSSSEGTSLPPLQLVRLRFWQQYAAPIILTCFVAIGCMGYRLISLTEQQNAWSGGGGGAGQQQQQTQQTCSTQPLAASTTLLQNGSSSIIPRSRSMISPHLDICWRNPFLADITEEQVMEHERHYDDWWARSEKKPNNKQQQQKMQGRQLSAQSCATHT